MVGDVPLVRAVGMNKKHSGLSGPNALPPESVGFKLQARAAEKIEAAWAKLDIEFDVQKMVWDSLGLSRGARHKGNVAVLQSKLQYACSARRRNAASAFEALVAAAQRNAEERLMSHDMESAVENTIQAERAAEACCKLAERIQAAGGADSPDPAEEEPLVQQITSCDLEPKLENLVRQALGLKKKVMVKK